MEEDGDGDGDRGTEGNGDKEIKECGGREKKR
jgi:hypothetical protein